MNVKKFQRDPATITIATFHEQNQLNKYNYSPPYQRLSVWSDEKQSYLIDSILRNFPIPPIFLHRQIDQETGKTTYDVIDGKQRLNAIARFINNEIPAANEYDSSEALNPLDGCYFRDLSSDEHLTDFKASFWKYNLSIEYVDASDVELIEAVFDRLNRNGEPLKGQELRNARYHSSNILASVQSLLEIPYLKTQVSSATDPSRMEDQEFCSECLLTVFTGSILGSNPRGLDALYEANKDKNFDAAQAESIAICNDLEALALDYQGARISGVSHLYGLWCLAYILRRDGKPVGAYKDALQAFFRNLRTGSPDPNCEEYKRSMSSRTKERSTRVKRVRALLAACGEGGLQVS